MIKLFSIHNPEESYTFLGGKKYKVGRKAGDITFPDDSSISRDHAEIEVDHPRANLDNPSLLPTLNVTDVGSKFKTYINGEIDETNGVGISTREPVGLSSGDRIRFGKLMKQFRVECTPLVVTGSTLKDTKELKDIICKLGGHFVAEWSDKCDFVVMDSVTLTIKAVCALLAGKYIVSPNYFKDLVASIQLGKEKALDPMDYTPTLVEASIQSSAVDFKPDPERSQLFVGKTFVFYSNKQMKKLCSAVTCGGGINKLINECSQDCLESPDTLMLQPSVDLKFLDPETKRNVEIYRKTEKRLLQESEISLAAVYVKLDKHCNPFFQHGKQIFNPVQTQTQRQVSPSKAPVIIPETQEHEVSPLHPGSRIVVEESFNMTSGCDKSPPSSSHVKTVVDTNGQQLGSTTKTKLSNPDQSMGPPASKRRLELETETKSLPSQFDREPSAKRQKSSILTIDKASKTLSKNKSKTTLSAIFQMSDSDPEDDDEEPSVIPGTYQALTPLPKPPADSTVKQTKSNTPSNEATASSSASNATPFVDYVPGTPEMSDEEEDFLAGLGINVPEPDDVTTSHANTVTKISKSRSTRNSSRREDVFDVDDDDMDVSDLPTVKIPTLPTAQRPTLVINPFSSAYSKTTKKTSKGESEKVKDEVQAGSSASNRTAQSVPGAKGTLSAWLTSNKRKTDKDAHEDGNIGGTKKKMKTNELTTFDILNRTKQIKLEDPQPQPDTKAFNPVELKPAPVEIKSLMRTCRPDFKEVKTNNITLIQNGDGSPKNFKKFQRVVPLSLYNSTLHKAEQKHHNNSERASTQFVTVDVNDLPDQEVTAEEQRLQENFEFDPVPSKSKSTKGFKLKESDVLRRSGRARKNVVSSNTPVEVVCDVDVDVNAIRTPSFGFKEDIEADDVDPSDGMFDF